MGSQSFLLSTDQRSTPNAVPIYFCPSRRSPGDMLSISGDEDDDPGPGPHMPGALGDYGACTGTDNCDGCDCNGKLYNGVFRSLIHQSGASLGRLNFASVTDGLSNTIFMGEKHVQPANFGKGMMDCSLYNGDYWICSSRSAGPQYPVAQWPNDSTVGFGSFHPNICLFLFGDGSVRSLSNTVNPNTMAILAMYCDGQTPGDY